MRAPAALMVNVLGRASMEETKAVLTKAMSCSTAGLHWYGKRDNKLHRTMAHYTVTAQSTAELLDIATSLDVSVPEGVLSPLGVNHRGSSSPRVAIIMGSDSDLSTMKSAAEVLDQFKVPYELTIVSAHRTPTRMYTFAQHAHERGIEVIIAGAGGAAHLPGMVAALTPLPVIGVPIFTTALHGQDSLLSIVQMPKGIPVATVAIGNASNAGLLAVRILGSQDGGSSGLLKKMDEFLQAQELEVLQKADRLEANGFQWYLNNTSTNKP